MAAAVWSAEASEARLRFCSRCRRLAQSQSAVAASLCRSTLGSKTATGVGSAKPATEDGHTPREFHILCNLSHGWLLASLWARNTMVAGSPTAQVHRPCDGGSVMGVRGREPST